MSYKTFMGVVTTRQVVETTRVEITEEQLKQIFPDIQIPQNRSQARKFMTELIQSMKFQSRFQIPGSLQPNSAINNSIEIFESSDEYDDSYQAVYQALTYEIKREDRDDLQNYPSSIVLSPTNRLFCFTLVFTIPFEKNIIPVEKSE